MNINIYTHQYLMKKLYYFLYIVNMKISWCLYLQDFKAITFL